MNTQQLKEYLGIVVDMEKNIFMQEHAIDQLESQSQLLGVPHHFSKPTPPVNRPGGLGPLLLVYAVFGVLAALILGWGLKRFFGTSLGGFIPGIFATCLGGVALLAVFAMAVKSIGEHSKDNEN